MPDAGEYRHQDAFVLDVLTVAGTSEYKVYDSNAPAKFRVIDVQTISALTGSGDTGKVTDGTSDITDAISVDTDNETERAATIDDAKNEISAGGSLYVVTASGAVARVLIYCVFTD